MQEEQEAALKKLRKNLKFKAKPVPNFYYEAPPAKPELKKVYLTRTCLELSIVLVTKVAYVMYLCSCDECSLMLCIFLGAFDSSQVAKTHPFSEKKLQRRSQLVVIP